MTLIDAQVHFLVSIWFKLTVNDPSSLIKYLLCLGGTSCTGAHSTRLISILPPVGIEISL